MLTSAVGGPRCKDRAIRDRLNAALLEQWRNQKSWWRGLQNILIRFLKATMHY